jgi:hypothetical protein
MISLTKKTLTEKKSTLSDDELEKKVLAVYEVPISDGNEITDENREMFYKAFGLSDSLMTGFLPLMQNPDNQVHPRMLRKFIEWVVSGNDDQYLMYSLINFSFSDKEQLIHHKWRVPYELTIPYHNKLMVKFPPFNPSKVLFAPTGTATAICRISICIGNMSGNKLFRSTQAAVIFYLDNELSYETLADFDLRMEKGAAIFVGMSLDFRNDHGEWAVRNPDKLPSRIVDAIYIE